MTDRVHVKGEVREREYRGSREAEVSGSGYVGSESRSTARDLSDGLSGTVARTMETAYEIHRRRSDG